MYIWQSKNWTDFSYQLERIQPKLEQVKTLQQQLTGQAITLPEGLDRQAEMDALIQNALQTSEIEDEKLNAGSVRSSVARHLGLEQAGLPPGTRQTDSLVAMLCDATNDLSKPLNQSLLCEWQAALFPEKPLLRDINIGGLRGDEPMQVISQLRGREVIHFEAPPKATLQVDLDAFIDWFNKGIKTKSKDDTGQKIIRAALTHLWLITLHPFDDGNGRVTRAVTDRALAQAENTSIRFYSLSAAIEVNRNAYYEILEKTQNGNSESQLISENTSDITDWLVWFLDVLVEALEQGLHRIDRVIAKAQFWQLHSQTVLIERQVKVLNRLLDNMGKEFKQGISARQYQSLAKVSKATATRDLADLLNKNCIAQLPGGGRSTRYSIGGGN
jgi:Fic family protein